MNTWSAMTVSGGASLPVESRCTTVIVGRATALICSRGRIFGMIRLYSACGPTSVDPLAVLAWTFPAATTRSSFGK